MELSQAARILHVIERGRGVTNYELSQISLKYSCRISELRQSGYNIIAIRQFINGRATGTWKYYLGEQYA